jgi:hypothetical protein
MKFTDSNGVKRALTNKEKIFIFRGCLLGFLGIIYGIFNVCFMIWACTFIWHANAWLGFVFLILNIHLFVKNKTLSVFGFKFKVDDNNF